MNSIGMIKGRYKLIDEIESGSFGTVYIARDMESNCLYAGASSTMGMMGTSTTSLRNMWMVKASSTISLPAAG